MRARVRLLPKKKQDDANERPARSPNNSSNVIHTQTADLLEPRKAPPPPPAAAAVASGCRAAAANNDERASERSERRLTIVSHEKISAAFAVRRPLVGRSFARTLACLLVSARALEITFD